MSAEYGEWLPENRGDFHVIVLESERSATGEPLPRSYYANYRIKPVRQPVTVPDVLKAKNWPSAAEAFDHLEMLLAKGFVSPEDGPRVCRYRSVQTRRLDPIGDPPPK